jgi:type IV secretory pathway VirB10-like protein
MVNTSFADIYKWVDAEGQIHYSQHAPQNQEAQLIKTPPPPTINPDDAQKPVDALIEQQTKSTKEKQERLEKLKADAEQDAIRKENCRLAQHNLQQYQNNPNRRITDANGNVTRPPQEERQNKIIEFQQYIKDNCY